MDTGFFRKLASQAKTKRKAQKWHLLWTRINLEDLDPRVLPSVNATLNGGLLKILADAKHDTAEVEVIQSDNQITVEDTGTIVNSFDLAQVQQIDFKYRELHHQHTKFDLTMPVDQSQMTLTGFAVAELDLGLGADSLTATAATTLPDGTAVSLTGPVNTDGTFDLAGSAALIDVGNFPLILPQFDLTDQGMTVDAPTILPVVGAADFTGSLTPDGTYALTTPLADFTISGYTLTHASAALDNNGLAVKATTTVPVAGDVNLTGDLTADGHYSLTASVPTVNLLGFTLNNVSATLDDAHDLTLGATATLPVVGDVTFTGSATPDGQYSLSATAADFALFGFTFSSVTATLDNSGLTASADVTLPVTGHVRVSGSVTPSGQYSFQGTVTNVTVLGFMLTNLTATVNNSGVTVDAHATLPIISTVDLSGQVQSNGNYNLTVTVSNASFLGFTLNTVTATFTNAGMTFGIDATLPIVNTVHLTGQVQANGSFSVAATVPSITLFGVTLTNVTATLDNNHLTAAADASIPMVGTVHVSGTVQSNGNYNLTATSPNINILGFTLTNVWVSLANPGGLTVTAHAAGIPLIGNVDFIGRINGGNFSFMATLTNVPLLGFTLNPVTVTLTSTSMSVTAHITNIPFAGTADFLGQIAPTGFSLAGTATNVDLLGFIHFNTIALTLNQSSMSLSAATTLPVVGNVTFTGAIAASGNFTISATAPQFTLLGFLTFNNATVSLSFPNPTLRVSAGIDLLNIGHVTFIGTIMAGGHFSLTVSASLTVAGFSLGTATLSISDARPCIYLGPFTTLPLPVIGPVTIWGTYCTGGMFSFDLDIDPSPPLVIGGLLFSHFHFGLNNTSLTFAGAVGINFTNLTIASANFQGTIHTNGDFTFIATVDAFSIAGLSGVLGVLTFRSVAGIITLGLHADTLYPLPSVTRVTVDGFIDVSHRQFSVTGSADVSWDGFPVASTTFTLTNNGVSVSATINVIVATVYFIGSVDHSNFRLTGGGTAGFAGFRGSGSFTLTNSGLTFSGSIDCVVATINGTISVSNTGVFAITLSTRMGFVGFGASGNLTLNNSGVSVSAILDLGVMGFRMSFVGAVHSDRTFSFTFNAGLNFGPVSGNLTLNLSNTGFSAHVHAAVDVSTTVIGIRVGFRGSLDVDFRINTDGSYGANFRFDMCAYVGISLCVSIDFSITNHQFCIRTSEIGFDIGGIHFHPFSDACLNY
jgi:hypothetical protein